MDMNRSIAAQGLQGAAYGFSIQARYFYDLSSCQVVAVL
jgi:hypothetical protein